jgi:pyrimidine-nucleoside phosphorylase
LEVLECIELLRGEIREGAQPVLDLSIELAARMVMMVELERSIDAARARIKKVYESGDALECFRRNVEAQGGDARVCDDPRKILPLTDKTFKVESPRPGFVSAIDTEEIGNGIAEAGGGRVRVEDKIDPTVGFLANVKIGDELKVGDSIGTVFCEDPTRGKQAAARIEAAYSVSEERPQELPSLIKEVIE